MFRAWNKLGGRVRIYFVKTINTLYSFCDGLVKSKIFVPIITKESINHSTDPTLNFKLLTNDSNIDNVLLEYWLALELYHRGFIDKIYPIIAGSKLSDDMYGNYFEEGGPPQLKGVVVVEEVEKALLEHLDRLCLGSALLQSLSVKMILSSILKHQGRLIVGDSNTAYKLVVEDVSKMIKKLAPVTEPVIINNDKVISVGNDFSGENMMHGAKKITKKEESSANSLDMFRNKDSSFVPRLVLVYFFSLNLCRIL